MPRRNVIQQAYDDFGKSAGGEKRSGSWLIEGDEVVSLTNLQKSQYGPSYYLNQGWWLKGVSDEEPRSEACHVQARIENLVSAEPQEVAPLLDLEVELDDEERRAALLALLHNELLPVIRKGLTIDGLREMRGSGQLRYAGITAAAVEVLDTPA